MAIHSSDEQSASEMSQNFECLNINDQVCRDAGDSAPIGDCWPPEPTYSSGFHLDLTGEPDANWVYSPESMAFDGTCMIQVTTDIGSEGSSLYPRPPSTTSFNEIDWPIAARVSISISDL